MNTSFSVGPILVPGVLPAFVAGYLVFRLVLSRLSKLYPEESDWVRDKFVFALLIAFLVWKIWPIFQWWPEIQDSPVILFRLPGGRSGLIAGITAASLFLVGGLIQARRRLVPLTVSAFGMSIGFLFGLALVETAVTAPSLPTETELHDLQVEYLATDRKTRPLIDIPDSPTVITFWATWCGPCLAELPVKKRFFENYGEELNFVAINMTATEKSTEAVQSYVTQNGIAYPVALDRSGTLSDLFAVRGTPTTIVLNPDGSIETRWSGPSSLDRLVRAVERSQGKYKPGPLTHDS